MKTAPARQPQPPGHPYTPGQNQISPPATHPIGKQTNGQTSQVSRVFSNAGALYDFLGSAPIAFDARHGASLVNMGYWSGLNPLARGDMFRANYALFRRVCQNGGLSEEDKLVVDVGCGFGIAALMCAREFRVSQVIGINVSPYQIEQARRGIARQNLQHRVQIQNMSATDMQFADDSIDKMISTEAAFHFDAREDFFGEAFRTLKTGGLLSLADIVFPEPRNGWQRMLLARMKNGLYIPAANIYGYESYLAKVKAAGFELVAAENITAKVRAPFRKWFGTHPLRTFFNHRLGWAIPNFGFLVYPWEYLTLVARKGNPR